MLKTTQISLFLLFTYGAFAQMSVSIDPRWSIDMETSFYKGVSQYIMDEIPDHSELSQAEVGLNDILLGDELRNSFSSNYFNVGASLSREIFPFLSLSSGLSYANYKARLIYSNLPINTPHTQDPIFLNAYVRQHTLEIPLKVRYVYSRKQCKGYVESGLIQRIHLNNGAYHHETQSNSASVSRSSRSAYLGLGTEIPILTGIYAYTQLNLMGSLQGRRYVYGIEKFQGFGIRLGMRYYFYTT